MSFLPLKSYKRQQKTRDRKDSEKRQKRRPTESDTQTGGAGAGEGWAWGEQGPRDRDILGKSSSEGEFVPL